MDDCPANDQPEVTDPVGLAAAPKCDVSEINAEQLAQAALLACEALVNYGPGGGSPCVAGTLGEVLAYPIGLRVGRCPQAETGVGDDQGADGTICVRVDPCANEVVTPDPNSESCYGEVKFLSVRPDATALITSVWGKLGGPGWIPRPPPPPPSA